MLRGLNFQLKHNINDLRASMCAMKETLVSIAVELKLLKIKCLILLIELQYKLNPHILKDSTVKVRALVGK